MSNIEFMEKLLDGVEIEWKALGEVATITIGEFVHKSNQDSSAKYPVYNGGISHTGFYEKYNNIGDKIIVSARGANAGFVNKISQPYWAGNSCYSIGIKKPAAINWNFVYYFLKNSENKIIGDQQKGGIPAISKKQIEIFQIPIPCPENPNKSSEIQTEIVRILDVFTTMTAELTAELTAEINTRKKQYSYYRNQLFSFEEGEVEWKPLEEAFDIFAGGDVPKDALSDSETEEFNIPILSNGIGDKSLYGWTNKAKIEKPSLTISARGTIGWTSFRTRPFFPIVRLLVLMPKIKLNLKYAYYFMKTIENDYKLPGAGIPQLTKPMIKDIKIPLPCPTDPEKSLAEQDRIVAILDKFDALTNSISEGLPREIELRQKQYEYYRDLLLSFPKPEVEA
ncbi:restriction endonuclease subunit S [Avibacterium paragallinarum]